MSDVGMQAPLEAMAQAALLVDDGEQIVAANAAASELFGHPAPDLVGASLELIAPDGLDAEMLQAAGERPFQAETSVSAAGDGHRLVTCRDVTAERRTASQLADAERIARVGIWEWHVPTNVVTWSDEAFTLFGRDPETEEPTFELWLETVHPEDREWVNEFVQRSFQAKSDYDFEHRVQHPDGTVKYMHCRGQVIVDESGEPLRLVGASQDVTERVHQQAELTRVAAQREAVLDAAGEGICGLDVEGRVSFANPAASRLLGIEPEKLIGNKIGEHFTAAGAEEGDGADPMLAAISDGHGVRDEDATMLRPDGEEMAVAYTCSPLREGEGEEEKIVGAVLTFADARERKSYEERLSFLAEHDALTGLHNRAYLEEELTSQRAYADRYGATLAVLHIDLDHFKDINDTRGHNPGDELLRAIAQLLRASTGPGDVLARLGADEFAILIPATSEIEAVARAETLREEIAAQRILAGGEEVQTTASIGVAVGVGSAEDPQSLLTDADVALYEAKERGRNRVNVYRTDHGGRERMAARLTWSQRIRAALDDDGFELFAQPIVDAPAGADSGPGAVADCDRFELLIRYRGEDGEYVRPDEFIPIAERQGMIGEIDRWVIRRSIEIADEQLRAGRRVDLELNLSGRSMVDHQLPGYVRGLLDMSKAEADQFVFEVTETAAIDNLAEAKGLAAGLVDLGCECALDDFGSGFGSFAYLKHLPIRYVKIDGDFIRNLASSPSDRLVVNAIAGLVNGMGKTTVAEMVEDAESARLCADYGVDLLQGYHLGSPGPLDEVLGAAIASA